MYWSVNLDNRLLGRRRANSLFPEPFDLELPFDAETLDDLVFGEQPELIVDLLAGIDLEDEWTAIAMTVIERLTRIVLDRGLWNPHSRGAAPRIMHQVPHPEESDY